MRHSSMSLPVLLVTLVTTGIGGCGSTARDPVRPVERATLAATMLASGPDCLPASLAPDPNAPVAAIESPAPSTVFTLTVPTTFTVRWSGTDADGRVRGYRFRLFAGFNSNFPELGDFVPYVLRNPQALEDLYGPCFERWDSAPPRVTSHTYTAVTPETQVLFAITAFDDDGKHDPATLGRNLVRVVTSDDSTLAPALSFTSGSWNATYSSGGYSEDPSRYLDLTVPPGETVIVRWSALPWQAVPIEGYRWGLDLANLGREGPRGPGMPPGRWTERRLDNTSATVGPFAAGETHLLFVDVTDAVGWASLGIVRLRVASGAAARAVPS